jgi:hypothetical protein
VPLACFGASGLGFELFLDIWPEEKEIKVSDVDFGGEWALVKFRRCGSTGLRLELVNLRTKKVAEIFLNSFSDAFISPGGVWFYCVKKNVDQITFFSLKGKDFKREEEIELEEGVLCSDPPNNKHHSNCLMCYCGYKYFRDDRDLCRYHRLVKTFVGGRRFFANDKFFLYGNAVIRIEDGVTFSLESGDEIDICDTEGVEVRYSSHRPRNFVLVKRASKEGKATILTLTDLSGEKPAPVTNKCVTKALADAEDGILGHELLILKKKCGGVDCINLKTRKPIKIVGNEEIMKGLSGGIILKGKLSGISYGDNFLIAGYRGFKKSLFRLNLQEDSLKIVLIKSDHLDQVGGFLDLGGFKFHDDNSIALPKNSVLIYPPLSEEKGGACINYVCFCCKNLELFRLKDGRLLGLFDRFCKSIVLINERTMEFASEYWPIKGFYRFENIFYIFTKDGNIYRIS